MGKLLCGNTVYGEECKSVNESPKDIISYWNTLKNHFPSLAEMAKIYLQFPIANCSVERSFSMYRYIYSERRKSFKEVGLKTHLFFAYNQKLIKKIYDFK